MSVFIVAVVPESGSLAMTASAPSAAQCRIVGGEKLTGAVRAESICQEIRRAMAKKAPAAHYEVDVKVLSRSRLSAIVTVNGRQLPEQNMAVSDGELRTRSIRWFAESLAAIAVAH